jgi:hypothetical protein
VSDAPQGEGWRRADDRAYPPEKTPRDSLSRFDDFDAELDRSWLADLSGRDAEVARLTLESASAAVAADADWVASRSTTDFEHIDHRPLGAGRMGSDDFVAHIANRRETFGLGRVIVRGLHVVGDVGVIEYELITRSDDHGFEANVSAIGLNRWRGEHCDRYEAFGAEQLDAALARAGELAAERLATVGSPLDNGT